VCSTATNLTSATTTFADARVHRVCPERFVNSTANDNACRASLTVHPLATGRAVMKLALSVALLPLLLISTACAPQSPTQPAAVPFNAATPTTLSLASTAGTGTSGGTAILVARVQNGLGTNLPAVTVHFTTDVGTLSATSGDTLADGTATITLIAAATAMITATTGTLSAHDLVLSNTPTPGSGVLMVSVTVQPGYAGSDTLLTANIKNGNRPVLVAWTYGDGASSPPAQPTTTVAHTYAHPGTYSVTASVTDQDGRTASGTGTATITTAPPGPPPTPSYVVTLAATPSAVLVGASSMLTATVTLVNGAPVATKYAWDCQGDGVTIVNTTVGTDVCTYLAVGTATTKVTATGGSGSGLVSMSASVSVTVTAVPVQSYTVSLAAVPSTVLVGASSMLTATVTPVNGAPTSASFAWDCQGDGVTIVSTAAVTHACTYLTAGTANPKVTVTGGTASGSASTSVTVTPLPSYSVSLAAAPASIVATTSTTFTATVTAQNGAPTPTNYAWTFGDGSALVNTAGPSTSHTYLTVNTFSASVIATATGGTPSGTGTIGVTVTPLIPVIAVNCSIGVKVTATSTCIASATLIGAPVPSVPSEVGFRRRLHGNHDKQCQPATYVLGGGHLHRHCHGHRHGH
jgi:PKD repeat protein